MTTNGSTASIIGVINQLYGSSTSASSAISKRERHVTGSHFANYSTSSNISYEYIINVQAQRFGLNGSFIVYAFLGDPPSSASSVDWLLADSLVGSHGFFSNPGMASKMAVTGAVPLTTSLLAKVAAGELASMTLEDVVPYLRTNLVWAIARTFDGAEVPAALVPGLQVSVVSAEATRADNDTSFPVWSDWTTLANITHGKPGGTSLGR